MFQGIRFVSMTRTKEWGLFQRYKRGNGFCFQDSGNRMIFLSRILGFASGIKAGEWALLFRNTSWGMGFVSGIQRRGMGLVSGIRLGD